MVKFRGTMIIYKERHKEIRGCVIEKHKERKYN